MKLKSLDELQKLQEKLKKSRSATERIIAICGGTGCRASNSQDVKKAFQEELKNRNLESEVEIKETGCHGLCEKGPIVIIRPEDIFYQTVQAKHVPEIVEKTLIGGEKVESILYRDLKTKERILHEMDIPFYKNQKRIVFGNNGHIDPTSIEDYLGVGGYAALGKSLYSMKPQDIVEEIKASGLRGRGGGGFPAGRKWQSCIDAPSDDGTRYVICNADEGDPGAFMDRSVLEGNPHIVIEGMVIGSIAVGATEGFVYVRAEYPLAVEHLTLALKQAEEYGLLGDNILGSGHSFRIKIVRGAGAFVCGESTALMASIEGKVGRPRAKYVHTVEKGLYDKPTVLNNVETWANVPSIVLNGGKWFSGKGTGGSAGTKVFSLVGNVVNTGLVEVPMGITLRRIIEEIGGGVKDGRSFKAVQTGGPSGGCIPAEHLDTPVDFDELTRLGSMMGSGGMIVLDDSTCMVNLARYYLGFLKDEACGKCTPCREGVAQMLHILENITSGKGEEGDIERLETLGRLVKDTSLCALGGTAPNPVLSTLTYFREEYEDHIKNGHCPAGECRGMYIFAIDEDTCTGCGLCRKKCPVEAISGERKEPHTIDLEICTRCGVCFETCPFNAVVKV